MFICLLMGLICLIGSHGADPSEYTTCQACVDGGNMWIEDLDCSQKCATKVDVEVDDNRIYRSKWRRRVISGSSRDKNTFKSCDVMENKCEILDYIKDPGFEINNGAWITYSTSPYSVIVSPQDGSPDPLDGERFAWLCGLPGGGCSWWMEQRKVKIEGSNTYLSFFLYVVVVPDSLSHLSVTINGEPVYHVDADSISTFPSLYVNVEIDVSKYVGEENAVKFFFYQEKEAAGSTSHSMAAIDNVQLIRRNSPSMMYNASVIDYCTSDCPNAFLSKGSCYDKCNTYICGYGGGSCDDSPGDVCYGKIGSEWPSKRGKLVCPKFVDRSCCTEAEMEFVNNFYNTMANKIASGVSCNVDSKCDAAIQNMICAPCSGNTVNMIHDGKIDYCSDYARQTYSACQGSYVVKNGECVLFSNEYQSINDWLSLFNGTIADHESCYRGETIKGDSDGNLLYIIIAIVAAVVVLIIIIAVVVALIIRSSNKKKKNSQQDIIVTEDGMIVGQPVVITDEFGNIIGQEMAPVGMAPTVIQDGVVVDGNTVVIQDGMAGSMVVDSGVAMGSVDMTGGMNMNSMGDGMMMNSGMNMNMNSGMNMNMNSGMNMNSMGDGMMMNSMGDGMMMNSGMNMNMNSGMNMNSMGMN